ncbi:MAG: polymer-forming cytoskeletal protein [Candidatus Hatepunaea meridiana]|nr:polymer-forming cytoskeletal protein [Candidatus Hatepunaea meridiana]
MAKSGMNRSGPTELSTIIGPDADFEGRLTVKQSMRIDGKVRGELESSETITIGNSGTVEGNISAKDIIVGGKITGKIIASGRTVLERTSVLQGDLKTIKLVVEEGAVFNGLSDMGEGGQTSANHPPRKITLSDE